MSIVAQKVSLEQREQDTEEYHLSNLCCKDYVQIDFSVGSLVLVFALVEHKLRIVSCIQHKS